VAAEVGGQRYLGISSFVIRHFQAFLVILEEAEDVEVGGVVEEEGWWVEGVFDFGEGFGGEGSLAEQEAEAAEDAIEVPFEGFAEAVEFSDVFVVEGFAGNGEGGHDVLAVDDAVGGDVLHVFGEGGVPYPG